MSAMFLWALGCHAPPEAPDGLDDSLAFLFREFHSDDAQVGAGLAGLVTWFDTEGDALLGGHADLDNVGAYELRRLTRDDTVRLAVEGDPDPADAPGVVSVAEMSCALPEAEGLVIRADQQVVFDTTWTAYDRAYDTDRAAYEAADEQVREPIADEDLAAYPGALLLTTNAASASELGYSLTLDLDLRFRHGTFELDGVPTDAYLVLGFMPRPAHTRDDDGENGIAQSYSLDVNVARPGGTTLRVFGAWSELDSPLIAADSPFVLAQGVNESQDAANRMSRICSGEIALPPEP